jgi:hypothetical protein
MRSRKHGFGAVLAPVGAEVAGVQQAPAGFAGFETKNVLNDTRPVGQPAAVVDGSGGRRQHPELTGAEYRPDAVEVAGDSAHARRRQAGEGVGSSGMESRPRDPRPDRYACIYAAASSGLTSTVPSALTVTSTAS